jgi:hypothetical protein
MSSGARTPESDRQPGAQPSAPRAVGAAVLALATAPTNEKAYVDAEGLRSITWRVGTW